jgi:general secretion pathway protein D
LKVVSTWISRLDNSDVSSNVKVYRVQYGEAKQLASLLNDIFVGVSNNDAPSNQIAPGSGVASFADRQNPPSTRPAATPRTRPPPIPTDTEPRYTSSVPVPGMPAMGAPGATRSGMPLENGQGLLPGVRIAADTGNNSLIIYANREHYRIIERTLRQLDRPQLQVAIDATIAEITLNDTLAYGVQFYLKGKDVGISNQKASVLSTGGAANAVLNRVLPGFNFLIGSDAEPRVILDALHGVTEVKVLSTPSLVVIDNQAAVLQVGDQIPIATRTAQSVDVPTAPVVNNVDYRNTGVILRVGPRINANGSILLDIEQEISNVANTANADTLTPTVSQRKVKSSIAMASGQTVLLGGLISDRQDRGRSGIPGIEQLPVLGPLLSRNSGAAQRTELLIFIRAQIIRDGVDAARIAQELRRKLRGQL